MRWPIEVTIKELKSGLHLGQMQVTRDADRVARSVALSVCAYLLLVHLYRRDEEASQPWSLCRLKQRFQADLTREERRLIELNENGNANSSNMRMPRDFSEITRHF